MSIKGVSITASGVYDVYRSDGSLVSSHSTEHECFQSVFQDALATQTEHYLIRVPSKRIEVRYYRPDPKVLGEEPETPPFVIKAIGYVDCMDTMDHATGFHRLMQRYAQMGVKGDEIDFRILLKSSQDYETARFGLVASMLIDAGRAGFELPSPELELIFHLDEMYAKLGKALGQYKTQGLIWYREFECGLIAINPHHYATEALRIGPGYFRLNGSTDSKYNDGQPQGDVLNLAPRTARVLLKAP